MEQAQPTCVGPYRVLRQLGAGGMAETFVAERTGPGGFVQQVCLKCIRPDMASHPEFVRQFLAEARILASLQHATIVQVLDFGQQDHQYYLALELVRGCDLNGLLGVRGRLEPAICVQVAIDLGTALGIAHRGGVIHRDVSPSNVLLSADGEIKLTDFGIAKVESGATRHTVTGVVKGKVPYMAPEYTQTGVYTARSDLFSLGVLLFECLSGRRPYEGATDVATMALAAMGQHDPLQQLAPGAPAGLCQTIEQLLRPNPEERPESAAALTDRLLDLPLDPRARWRLAQAVGQVAGPPVAVEGPLVEGQLEDTAVAYQSGERLTPQTPNASGRGADFALDSTAPRRPPDLTHTAAHPPGVGTQDVTGSTLTGHDESYEHLDTAFGRPRWLPRVVASTAAAGLLLGWLLVGGPEPDIHIQSQAATEPAHVVTPPPSGAVTGTTPHQATPHQATPHQATPHQATPHQATPHQATPREAPSPVPPSPTTTAATQNPLVGQFQNDPTTGQPQQPSEHRQHRKGTDSSPAGRKSARATLTVVVIPFGDVTIDGKSLGQAPVTTRLTPGTHRVVADSPTRRLSRTLTLAPGQRKRLVLR